MNHTPDETPEATQLTTILNRVRPTVVVRRRVYEVPQAPQAAPIAHVAPADEDDEAGPPSSVNVARALSSLRAHEIRRLEQILGAQDEEQNDDQSGEPLELAPSSRSARQAASAPAAPEPPPPAVPTVRVGQTITIAELAQQMSMSSQDLVTALVTRGFFSVTVKSTLHRETARAAAVIFDFKVEETDEVAAAPPKKRLAAKAPVKHAPAKHAAVKHAPAKHAAVKHPAAKAKAVPAKKSAKPATKRRG